GRDRTSSPGFADLGFAAVVVESAASSARLAFPDSLRSDFAELELSASRLEDVPKGEPASPPLRKTHRRLSISATSTSNAGAPIVLKAAGRAAVASTRVRKDGMIRKSSSATAAPAATPIPILKA